MKIKCQKTLTDKYGRILILDTEIDDSEYILINSYNLNTESEQPNIFEELLPLLNNLELEASKHNIFSGDFTFNVLWIQRAVPDAEKMLTKQGN